MVHQPKSPPLSPPSPSWRGGARGARPRRRRRSGPQGPSSPSGGPSSRRPPWTTTPRCCHPPRPTPSPPLPPPAPRAGAPPIRPRRRRRSPSSGCDTQQRTQGKAEHQPNRRDAETNGARRRRSETGGCGHLSEKSSVATGARGIALFCAPVGRVE